MTDDTPTKPRYVLFLGRRHCPDGECVAPRTRRQDCHVPRLTERLRRRNLEMWRAGKRDASTPAESRPRKHTREQGQ